MHCSRRLILQTLAFSRSYLHRQVSPPKTLVVKGGTTWARNGRWILPENTRLPRNIQGSFTCRKSTTWNKRFYFLSEGRCAEDFFRPEKSDSFGRGWTQHATSRPPKLLMSNVKIGRCKSDLNKKLLEFFSWTALALNPDRPDKMLFLSSPENRRGLSPLS